MNEMEEQVISISEIFEAIKKRWIIIVAITLTATIISGIISFFVIDPVYEASTKVFEVRKKMIMQLITVVKSICINNYYKLMLKP